MPPVGDLVRSTEGRVGYSGTQSLMWAVYLAAKDDFSTIGSCGLPRACGRGGFGTPTFSTSLLSCCLTLAEAGAEWTPNRGEYQWRYP